MKAKPIIVGIAGGTGAGKTVLARAVANWLDSQDVIIIQQDSYYRDRSDLSPSEREKLNYDHPDALETDLLIQHLKELIAGNTIEIPVYDFTTHCRSNQQVQINPVKVIILEGTLLLANVKLRKLIDVKIFVDTDDDIRFIKRLRRDINERRRNMESVIEQYLETVRPMHIEFVEPSRKYADIIIPEGHNPIATEMVVSMIKSNLFYRNAHEKINGCAR